MKKNLARVASSALNANPVMYRIANVMTFHLAPMSAHLLKAGIMTVFAAIVCLN